MAGLCALVLAGRRGPDDPLAEAHGASHRALLPVGGVPMVLRVVRSLLATKRIEKLHISIEAPEHLQAIDELAELERGGRLRIHRSESSPSRSVAAVLEADDAPYLVTTADHALLDAAMLDHFLDAMAKSDADVLVGLVSETLLEAAYPETKRTYLRFRSEAWSGANLFGCRTPDARKAVDFWRRAERHRKRPWRLVSAIGADLAALYMAGRLDIDEALVRASKKIGVDVRKVAMPIPEAAIDVDRQSDLELASRILAEREAS
jgi:GTP:adenosylcobinamide-phosphate guanylyltransferase